MLRMLRCSLDLMLTERLVVARLKPVSVSIVSLLDVMLTVSLVLFLFYSLYVLGIHYRFDLMLTIFLVISYY